MDYFKYLAYLLPALVVVVFIKIAIRDIKNNRIKKRIASDPVHVNARITQAVPGTPAPKGIVNVTLDYEFNDHTGRLFTQQNVVTVVKTMEMLNYKVGETVPVMYLRSDPSLNKVNLPRVF
ncbi:hypothetical protein [Kosakonia pseudosacchari]|uniref:DUF3592 domain-containing protein n=1 Tax=Kosakonia pseudosacchari TaxID=1646340 RepID=A0ABX4IWA3_9ENTR|nr:hypothetical protein [Kosakonia pseudosacchari]PDO90379.1 hypothetical protein BK796_02105 [Kosakonia pseudosacchari]